MEDFGRETDGSRSGGLSTSATFTTDDGGEARDQRTSAVEQFQMQDLKSVQYRCARTDGTAVVLRDPLGLALETCTHSRYGHRLERPTGSGP